MKYLATITESVQETHNVKLIRLSFPEISQFKFRPGQWIGIWDENFKGENNKPIRRAFSIARKTNNYLELCVARGENFSAHLQDLPVGSKLNIDGPYGNFWARPSKEYLFVAGGTGIAPLLGMIEEVLQKNAKATLLFSMKTPSDFVYKKELESLKSNPKFTLVPTITANHEYHAWQYKTGRIQFFIQNFWKKGIGAYLCGPPLMVEEIEKKLISLGQPKEDVHMDKWE